MAFGLPIFDTTLALVRRLVNRRPIMMPDRSHLYNQLVDRLSLSVKQTVGLLYAVSVLFACVGLLVLRWHGRHAAILYYAALAVVFLLVVWRLGFLRMTPEEKAAADRYLPEEARRQADWQEAPCRRAAERIAHILVECLV